MHTFVKKKSYFSFLLNLVFSHTYKKNYEILQHQY